MQDIIRKAANVTPSPRQLAWQGMEFYAFAHFGMNTFTGREWGDGTEDPAIFDPTDFDADQWVAAVKSAGMTGLLLTAKHHDGFCLWPSAYTAHSVAASPWRGGKGDVVREVADACKRGGIKFGVYLSPWDRHEPAYGEGEAYNVYYKNQLRELATNYGDIFCFWFDGACGEGKNGKKQAYDWQGYYEIIRELQPNAVINVSGPDVRWCGNEAGVCRSSEWSVVPAALRDNKLIAEHSQHADDGEFSRAISSMDEDLGSREAIADAKELIWYPAEVDTSIRTGWFYHPEEDAEVRSLDELLNIYYNAVGANACLLLNIPPDTRGRFADADVARLAEMGAALREAAANEPAPCAAEADTAAEGHGVDAALQPGEGWWQAAEGSDTARITLRWAQPVNIRQVRLGEQLTVGQRIENFRLLADGRPVAEATVVGWQRICRLENVTASELTVEITASRTEPTLRFLRVYG